MIKHSQIIISIARGEKTLTNALFELKVLLSDLDNLEIVAWIENELNGYFNKKDVPPRYRELKGSMFGTVQSIEMGNLVSRKMIIPIKIDKMNYVNTYIYMKI